MIRYIVLMFIFFAPAVHADDWLVFQLKTHHAGDKVSVVASFNDWHSIEMTEIGAGLYTVGIPVPAVPEFLYKLNVNGKWQHDATNPSKEPDGFGGWNSVYKTGFTEDDLLLPPSQYVVTETVLHLKDETGQARDVVVLVPNVGKTILPILFFHDGGDYLNRAYASNFIANLWLKKHQAFAAAFISPIDRTAEYGATKENVYDRFVQNTVIPEVHAVTGTPMLSKYRIVIGPSLAGNAALREGLQSGLFGYVASQSGAFWYWESELQNIVNGHKNSPMIFLENGIFEGTGIVEGNEKLEGLLKENNITFSRSETPTAHNWLSWRNRLDSIVEWYVKNF